jgi:hypothetical protein
MTPYTSFLVVEDGDRPALAARLRGAGARLEKANEGREAVDLAQSIGGAKRGGAYGPAPAKPGTGTVGDLYGFAEGEKKDLGRAVAETIVHVADKTFYRKADGILYDSLYDEAKHKDQLVEVKALSDAYFELLTRHEGSGRYLAEGKPMVIILDGKAYKITT